MGVAERGTERVACGKYVEGVRMLKVRILKGVRSLHGGRTIKSIRVNDGSAVEVEQ